MPNIDGAEAMIRLPLRRTPPLVAAEAEMLAAWLEWHRATLIHKCHGLDAAELATRTVEPSGLTLHGLLRHMTDVEQWWFQIVFAGRTNVAGYGTGDDLDATFIDLSDTEIAVSLEAFESACAESRRIAAGASLDDLAAHPRVRASLRWVMIHMIEEYARHNGAASLTECG